MNKPTDDEIDELWRFEASKNWDSTLAMRTGFARAILARWGQPAHSGEPVAWLDPWTGTNVTADPDAYGKHGIPLVRQQPVVREPLTDEQIDQAIAELGLNYLADAHATNRAVLRKLRHHAHGIKGGQHDF